MIPPAVHATAQAIVAVVIIIRSYFVNMNGTSIIPFRIMNPITDTTNAIAYDILFSISLYVNPFISASFNACVIERHSAATDSLSYKASTICCTVLFI